MDIYHWMPRFRDGLLSRLQRGDRRHVRGWHGSPLPATVSQDCGSRATHHKTSSLTKTRQQRASWPKNPKQENHTVYILYICKKKPMTYERMLHLVPLIWRPQKNIANSKCDTTVSSFAASSLLNLLVLGLRSLVTTTLTSS